MFLGLYILNRLRNLKKCFSELQPNTSFIKDQAIVNYNQAQFNLLLTPSVQLTAMNVESRVLDHYRPGTLFEKHRSESGRFPAFDL